MEQGISWALLKLPSASGAALNGFLRTVWLSLRGKAGPALPLKQLHFRSRDRWVPWISNIPGSFSALEDKDIVKQTSTAVQLRRQEKYLVRFNQLSRDVSRNQSNGCARRPPGADSLLTGVKTLHLSEFSGLRPRAFTTIHGCVCGRHPTQIVLQRTGADRTVQSPEQQPRDRAPHSDMLLLE